MPLQKIGLHLAPQRDFPLRKLYCAVTGEFSRRHNHYRRKLQLTASTEKARTVLEALLVGAGAPFTIPQVGF